MQVDILYLAWNRREFTEFTFDQLLRNTDWDRVRRLVCYDDGSKDGADFWLSEEVVSLNRNTHIEAELRHTTYRSPVAVMNDYLRGDPAEWFCKIDNDIVVPPNWLHDMTGVLERNPEVELLGMDAGRHGPPGHNGTDWDGVYEFEPGSHIGGVGMMNSEAIIFSGNIPERGRFGWTEHQYTANFTRGWIKPDILVASLDMVPVEPWMSLSEEYVRRGWQREWPRYDPKWSYWWEWFTPGAVLP